MTKIQGARDSFSSEWVLCLAEPAFVFCLFLPFLCVFSINSTKTCFVLALASIYIRSDQKESAFITRDARHPRPRTEHSAGSLWPESVWGSAFTDLDMTFELNERQVVRPFHQDFEAGVMAWLLLWRSSMEFHLWTEVAESWNLFPMVSRSEPRNQMRRADPDRKSVV